MAEDEEKEEKHEKQGLSAGLSSGLIWAVVLAIFGLLLSGFSIIESGTGMFGLPSALVFALSSAALGFCLGFVYGLFPKESKWIGLIIVILVLVLVAYWLFSTGNAGIFSGVMSPLKGGFGNVAKGLGNFKNTWSPCLALKPPCPFLIDWETPNVETKEEEVYVKVETSENKISQDNQLNMLVSLTVKNPTDYDVNIKPKCYLERNKTRELKIDKMGTYASGEEFIFSKTQQGQELHTSFRCTGDIIEASDKNVYSDYVIVVLERPVTVNTVWPVKVGQEPKIGLVKSEMKFNAPYTISMTSDNDMPFAEGHEYDFQIVLKRAQEDSKLKSVEYIDVKYQDEIMASCQGFNGIDHEFELKDYSYESLKSATSVQYDKDYDKFSWPCTLYVSSASQNAVLSPMELNAKYTVYTDYPVKILKSP